MTEQLNWDERPPGSEWNVLDNVTPAQAEANCCHVDEETRFVTTCANPPKIGSMDDTRFRALFLRHMKAFLRETGVPPLDDVNEPLLTEDSFGFVTMDRTAHFALPTVQIVTTPLLELLQKLLRLHWPLWRLRITTDEREDDIIVYPDVFRVGTALPDEPLQTALAAWTLRVGGRWEAFRGPKRRQFRWVLRHMANAVERVRTSWFDVVGVFDSSSVLSLHPVASTEYTIWILRRRDVGDHCVMEQPEQQSTVGGYPVDKAGRVGREGMNAASWWFRIERLLGIHEPDDEVDDNLGAPYRLESWVVDRADDFVLELKMWPDGPSQSTIIRASDVITDSYLKSLEDAGQL